MTTILVTGATGTVGTQVVKALAEKSGTQVRVGVRNASSYKGTTNDRIKAVELDWANAESQRAALAGVDRAFLLTPFVPNQVEIGTSFVDLAKQAGVKHLVKLSAIGCEIEPGIQLGRWHRAIEKHVEASGLAWTFLRPNNFMENFIGYYPPQGDGNIYLPFGDGSVSWIAARDIGEVAAVTLTESIEKHAGQAYVLTGSEALSVKQVAAILSSATERSISFVDVPEEAARKAMLDAQLPAWMVDAMMELHAIDKAGYASAVSPLVQQLTGRSPTSFADFARQNAAAWRK
ncbi:MAG: SDR family oxidoreductase [Polyangiaceae bacterium]